MLLYHDPRAPNPRRVRIFLAEKHVTYDTIEVLISSKANEAPEFRRKSPLALLPVLELPDGRVLRETMAICRYIEDIHPEPNLYGLDPWERAQIEMWNRHAELELLYPIRDVFRNTHAFWAGRIKQAPEYGAIMKEIVAERMTWFDRELANRQYIACDRFSVADITALCSLEFGRIVDVRIKADVHPHLAAWHARVSERESTKA